MKAYRKCLFATLAFLTVTVSCVCMFSGKPTDCADGGYIRWMEFKADEKALKKAMEADIASNSDDYPINWIDLIAYAATKNGNSFKGDSLKSMDEFVKRIKDGETVEDITADMKYFPYYKQTYSAVLGEFLGEYEITTPDGTKTKKYGLKAFCPIAEGCAFSHYDDFGAGRSYGFKRKHLGNDLLGRIGTPITAVEGGTVEALGWNRYGGWRIGIRSFDKKRYYYYAHLRKDKPYVDGLKQGDTVKAGDPIGYLGMTGYSTRENVNNINIPHLHFGMQIIFDESQKDGNNEIWIDVYDIINLLSKNRSSLQSGENGKPVRKYNVTDIENGGGSN